MRYTRPFNAYTFAYTNISCLFQVFFFIPRIFLTNCRYITCVIIFSIAFFFLLLSVESPLEGEEAKARVGSEEAGLENGAGHVRAGESRRARVAAVVGELWSTGILATQPRAPFLLEEFGGGEEERLRQPKGLCTN